MPPDPSPQPGRRTLLRTTLAAGILSLAGCGIRLEDDAPALPLVPTRTPIPAEDRLTALARDCDRLADLAASLPGALAADLAVVHRRQHTVLRTTLLRLQVPAAALDPARPGPAPSPTASAGEARAALAAAEATAAAGAARFDGVGPALRAPVAALHAQRYAAAVLLGGPPAPDGPVGAPAVDDVVTATDVAVYLTEVGTARSAGARRRRGTTTLAALRALRTDLVAGGDRPPPVLGVPLPFAVRTGAEVDRLLRETLTTLRATMGASLDLAADTGAGLSASARRLGVVEVEAHRWGVPLAPFPGLT